MIQPERPSLTAVIPHAAAIVWSVAPIVSACAMPAGASSILPSWRGIIGGWEGPPGVVVPIAAVKMDIRAGAASIAPAVALAPIAAVTDLFSFDTVLDLQ